MQVKSIIGSKGFFSFVFLFSFFFFFFFLSFFFFFRKIFLKGHFSERFYVICPKNAWRKNVIVILILSEVCFSENSACRPFGTVTLSILTFGILTDFFFGVMIFRYEKTTRTLDQSETGIPDHVTRYIRLRYQWPMGRNVLGEMCSVKSFPSFYCTK